MVGQKAITISVFATLLFAAQSGLWGQGNTGSLTGTILDEQDLRLPNVSLTLQNIEDGLKRTSTSGNDGTFEFTALHPGTYTLTAESAGFQPTALRVTLEVNQKAKLDVVLPVASQSETVQVVESMQLLHPN